MPPHAATPPPGRPVAVFDLDATLVRGDSFGSFVARLILGDWYRAAAALPAAPLLRVMYFLPAARRYSIAGFLWLATAGRPAASFDALVEEFAAAHAAPANQIPAVLDRLRAHAAAGDRVIIATGCADAMAAAVARQLGLGGVEIIAARLRRSARLVRPRRDCRMWSALPRATGASSFGAEKVRRLAQIGVTPPIAYAYSDSRDDLALLRAAARPCLVGVSPTQLRRLSARGLPGCEVLDAPAPRPPGRALRGLRGLRALKALRR